MYFDEPIPSPETIRDLLTDHAFEVESLEKVQNDTLIDIKVLPDRAHDCLSHRGIAREVSVLSGVPLKKEVFNPRPFTAPESNILKVEIEDIKLCKRFSALVIDNIEVRESPEWLQDLLETIGQRSINNVVDATNFVMFSLGQPLHAYDKALLTEAHGGYKIVARRAKNGEVVKTLGEKDFTLSTENLVIADANKDAVLGIAAIRGGDATKITKSTTSIVIEAANFDAINIRKTSKQLGLRTDASVRFENDITPELTMRAIQDVTNLLFEIAKTDETQVEGLVDIYPKRVKPHRVGVSLSEIKNVIGIDIKKEEVESILDKDGLIWSSCNPREKIVERARELIGTPYKFGSSVTFDSPLTFDCSSFSAYLHVEAGISIPRIAIDQFVFGSEITKEDALPGDLVFFNTGESIHTTGEYYSNVLGKNVSQIAIRTESVEYMAGTKVPQGVDHIGIYIGDNKIIHASGSLGVVESTIGESKQLSTVIGYRRMISNDESRYVITVPAERLDLRIKEDLIEEIGRIYGYRDVSPKEILPLGKDPEINKISYYEDLVRHALVSKGFSEVMSYAFVEKGEVELLNPIATDKAFLRSTLAPKIQESLEMNFLNIDLLGLSQIKIFELGKVFQKDGEYISLAIAIKNPKSYKQNTVEAEILEITQALAQTLGTEINFEKVGDVYTVNFTDVVVKLPTPHTAQSYLIDDSQFRYKKISPYPYILRDIAVFVPDGVAGEEIVNILVSESGDLLVQYTLFDVFTKNFPEGARTSYAYRLVFQSFEKTLTDDEVNQIMERVNSKIAEKSGWQVR